MSRAPVLRPGTLIGNYRLLRPLARGGMGAVMAAEHLHLGHRAAIKLLHRELVGDDSARARFVAEAIAMSRVRHPGVVGILDFGSQGETCYLVMELLRGESLAERLARSPRPPLPWALDLVRQLASALGAAHAAGVVHRDLKPANVVLTRREDGRERAVLLDFGLAAFVAEGDPGGAALAGAVWGTPYYMSPEQSRGGPVDPRSDVYSLGCLLYELLRGRPPFRGGVLAVLDDHQHAARPRADHENPGVPTRLADLVQRMMDVDPARRPRDMAQVVAELRAFAPRTRVPTWRPVAAGRARPAAAVAVVVTAIALASVLATLT